MVDSILNWIYQLFSTFSPFTLFLCMIFVGMFVCWRGAMETRKNRSSVFDLFLISIFLGFIIGRIVYIASNYDDFSGYIWYWLPYERYGDQVYWFRLLPWRFLNIFDGGLNLLAMFVTYLLAANFWSSSVKKWRWSQMFPTVYFSGETMLAISFVLLGLNSANGKWILQGGLLLLFPLIAISLIQLVNRMQKPILEKRIYTVSNIVLSWLSAAIIGGIYFTGDLNIFEKIPIYVFFVWTFFSTIFFIRDLKKANVVIEKVSSVREIGINRSVKITRR